MRTALVGLVAFLAFSCAAKFKCPAPLDTGLECKPVSEVYSTYTGSGGMREKLPETRKQGETVVRGAEDPSGVAGIVKRLEVEDRVPLRLPPKVVRIWFAPFEDEDGDLNQGGYIYVEIPSEKKWIIGEKAAGVRGESAVRGPVSIDFNPSKNSGEDEEDEE